MTDLIERVKLGDRRKVWITVEPGEYGDTEDAFVRVKAKVQVQVIQVYQYTYQTLRTEPKWFVAEYLWDTAHAYGEPHPGDPPPEPPRPSWFVRLWQRLFGGSPLPKARALRSGS